MFRQQFRRDLKSGRFVLEFALSATAALEKVKAIPDPSLGRALRAADFGADFLLQGGYASEGGGSTRQDLLAQFLVHDIDRTVDISIRHAELVRNQLHQQVDPLNEGCSTGYGAGCR
jgi:hypothetical protein